jgi:type III restriction enzyme
MKLKFDSTLSYQLDAIDSTVQVFDGQPSQLLSSFELHGMGQDGLAFSELGIGNQVLLSDEQFLENVRRIQSNNHLERVAELQGRNFSIEMETGTGKTYVYLRSIFELSKVYGFTKFIIVVPSIPIREGVLKSLDIMREHFKTLYDNVPFDYFVYDPKKLGKIRQFTVSNQIQVMVINIQSFQRDVMDSESGKGNVIYRENDKMSGWRPIDFINATNPIVIIDEPQSVDNTETSKKAISRLNPSAILRYSATHRNPYNLIYSLDPIRAYDLRLVKRIEVASVAADADFSESYVKLISATNSSNVIKAKLEIYKDGPTGPKKAIVTVKQNDDLGEKSGGHPEVVCKIRTVG